MRKRGKKHSTLAVVPLNMKRSQYALDAHAALLALGHNVAKESHLVDLYTLAELCQYLGLYYGYGDADSHIITHGSAVKRLCDEIHAQGYQCQPMQYASMEASASLLIDWFEAQPNARIARVALELAGKIERRA